jgi:hypothetical protein
MSRPCRSHVVPLSCCAVKGRFTHSMPRLCPSPAMPCPWSLECVFPVWFTQCGRVWFSLVMPRPCPALTMPFFSRPQHRTAVERGLWATGPRSASSGYNAEFHEGCYQKHTNLRCRWPVWNQTTFVMDDEKSGSSTPQKRRSVKLLE